MRIVTLIRKPLDSGFVANVLEWDCGVLHIEACRTDYEDEEDRQANAFRPGRGRQSGNHSGEGDFPHYSRDWGAWSGGKGRWPTNVVVAMRVGAPKFFKKVGS